jgi:hypothetical protein
VKIIYRCALALAVATPPIASGCVPDLPPGGRQIESVRYVITYRARPAPIAVSRHFALEFAVCAKDGKIMPDNVRVDAHMPEHRHGMNYKASVRAEGGGRYTAQGMLFHMPGRWELIFELRAAGQTDRLTYSEVVE